MKKVHETSSSEMYVSQVEAVLVGLGFATSKKGKTRLYGELRFDDARSITLQFKRTNRGDFEGFLDFHDSRHLLWLERLFNSPWSSRESLVYVHRLRVSVPRDGSPESIEAFVRMGKGRTREVDIYNHIGSYQDLLQFCDHLAHDLATRTIPRCRETQLEHLIQPKHWLREAVLCLRGTVVGFEERPEWLGDADASAESLVWRDRWTMYWRRGGFLDLAALLALGRNTEADRLIAKLPKSIGVSQGYVIADERVPDEMWQTACTNAHAIRNTLKL